MSNPRFAILLGLIGVFVAGVFLVNLTLRGNQKPGANTGDAGTIHGVVKTLLPSGKVIEVQKEDGTNVLVSLTDASAITDEIGEALFYRDVQVGMPISAAGIHGVSNNVLIPSLVTVKLAFTANGLMNVQAPTLRREYFSLKFNSRLWDIASSTAEIRYKTIPVCHLIAGASDLPVDQNWKVETTERKIGGEVFKDTAYKDPTSDALLRRTLVLNNPGQKYGLESTYFSSYVFQVATDSGLTPANALTCVHAVDAVLETFKPRGASDRIIVAEPPAPIYVDRDQPVTVIGSARTYDGTITVTVITENDRELFRKTIFVPSADSRAFGRFEVQIPALGSSVSGAVALRVFQYSPTTGEPTDEVRLPMTVQ